MKNVGIINHFLEVNGTFFVIGIGCRYFIGWEYVLTYSFVYSLEIQVQIVGHVWIFID